MIQVTGRRYQESRTNAPSETYYHTYPEREGLKRIETCFFVATSDFSSGTIERVSEDNGKTWSEWRDVHVETGFETIGEHERNYPNNPHLFWNPVHKHFVGVGMDRFFREGHTEAYKKQWAGDYNYVSDHAYVSVRTEDGKRLDQLVMYEDGTLFDPADPLNPEHFHKNRAFPADHLEIDDNGDILFPMGIPVAKCCEIAGVDVNEHFPSCPHLLRNLIFIRGVWDGEKYNFIPSRPILISDLKSSRGADEPTVAKLKSGRILIVFRGSNWMTKDWNTRIEPGTPGFKWYTYSDDGGKTFVTPMPWHFDDGEVIYSSATYSHFVRDARNGRLYWIGNITDHTAYENWPRWPLHIVEVDETYGTAKKETLTVIDTKREGESNKVQLTNFYFLQDRETGHLEVYLTKLSQYDNQPAFKGEPWVYDIILPE